MADDKYIQALYDQLSPKLELGDVNQFKTMLGTDDKFRKAIYDQATTDLDLGDYASFEGLTKKKVPTLLDIGQGTGIGSQEPQKPQETSLTPQQPSESDKGSYLGDLFERIGAGAIDIAASSPKQLRFAKRILDVPRQIVKKELGMFGLDEKTAEKVSNYIPFLKPPQIGSGVSLASGVWDKIEKTEDFQNIEEKAQELRDNSARYDKLVLDYVKNKEYKKAVGASVLNAAESLPLTLTAAFGGGVGLAGMGMYSASAKYDELAPNTDMTEFQKMSNALLNGSFEILTERLGSANYGKLIKSLYKTAGKETAENAIKSGVKSWLVNTWKKAGIYTAPVGEGLEEAVNQFASNVTARVTGEDEDRPLDYYVFDAAASGVASGAVFTGIGLPAQLRQKQYEDAQKEKEKVAKEQGKDAKIPKTEEVSEVTDKGTVTTEVGALEVPEAVATQKAQEDAVRNLSTQADAITEEIQKTQATEELSDEQKVTKIAELTAQRDNIQQNITNQQTGETYTIPQADGTKLTFSSKQEFFDWLDKNGEQKLPSPNEIGYLDNNVYKAIDEWKKINKKRLAQEAFAKEEERARQLQAIEDLKAAEKTDEPVGTITKLETKDGRDNYNVVNEEGQRDTFSVPEGSPQEVVQAKSEELVKPKETKDTQSIIRESSIDELRNLPENIDGDRGNKAFNIFDKIDWSSRESILEGLSAISEIINGKWVPKERLVEYLNTAKKIIGSDNIWSKDFIGRWIAVRTKDFSKVQSASETKVAIKDIVEPTTTNPVFKGTISTPSGEGHFSAQIHEDGTAHLMDIQIGYDKNAPRGKGYGKNAYIEIGNELAKRGYVLESTRWEKHNTAISPQSLAIWAKLEKEGLAKKTGTSESKIYNRETGEETIQNIPTYEFVKPTETGGQTDAQRSGTENQKVIEQVTPELVGQESDTGGVRNNEQVEPIEEEVKSEKENLSTGNGKSILNQETDLLGDKKNTWMKVLDKTQITESDIDEGKTEKSKSPSSVQLGSSSKYFKVKTEEYPKTYFIESSSLGNGKYYRTLNFSNGELDAISNAGYESHVIGSISDLKKVFIKFYNEGLLANPKYSKDGITRATERGWYVDAIKEGRMTANDAKTIIESAGLEVPQDILSLIKQPKETGENPKELTETPKEAISATQETGGGKISQTKEKSVETAEKAPKEGSAQMTLGIRALNSPKLDQDIKDGIAEKGINYEPRGRQVRADEAKEIVDLFGQEEGGLDKIEAMVYNTKNDIPNDTRTFLNVYLADAYNNLKNKSIDSAEKDRLRRKVIDLYMFGMEQGKLGGQHVEAQKEWGKVFGSSPEMVSALVRNHIERKNQQFFKNKEEEIAAAKKLLDDVFASPEGKARMEQEVSDEISKIGTKNFGKESKQKIDDFFSKLLIDPKQQNLYGGFLGIPVAAWNGSVLAVKNAVLLGVDLATAIQRGAEYLDKWYKDEYAKGKIASPDWNKAEYESHMRDKLSGLKKEVPTTDKKKATKKEPKPKTPPTQEEVVNKLLEKMAGFATKKQLQNFIKDYIQELQEKGVVDDKRFKDLLSKALGLDYVSDKTEAQLTASAQTLGHAQRKIQEVIDLFNQLESVEPGSREFADLRKKLNEAKKEAEKASFNAQKANQYIKTLLTDEPELLDKVGTLIQGNLLVPTSIIRNLYGNVFMAPARATRFMVMNTADAFLSKVGIARDLMKDPTSSLYINPVKNPELYKWAMKLPTTERTVDMMASFRGYREGVWQGLKEGARQLKTGQLEDDYRKKEIQRGLQPIEALLRLRDSLTGREKRSFDKMVGDLLEALPAGYMGEGMFRLLNLGDKPFRRAAETARLSEIAELKGLKDLQREKFLNNPDNASLEEARKAGDFAVYTNDNAVSKMIDYLNTTFKKGQKSNSDAIKSTSAIAKALFKLGKATTLPYVRTPVNLAVEAFEYAVPTYSLARALESTAKGKRREALDYFGKATVGAIISSVAVALIKSGIMTPAGSDEDKLEQAEFTGKEGYRMNIDAFHRWINGGDPTWQDGDETVTLKGYGTMSMIMMAYGAAYKGKTAEEIEAESNPERWATVFGSVVTSSLEQSIMTGVNTALQAALKGEKERDRWLINTANALSTAVYPNTVASISKTFADENYIRETRDLSKEDGRLKAQMVNTFKDRLFMGKDLPTKVSIWGEPVKMIPDGDNWTYMLLGVTKNKKYQKYSFGVKMYELYEEFKKNNPDEAKNIFPSLPTANSKVGWDDSKMTPHELQNYQMRVGELRAEYAENYVNSEEWKNATIDDRVQKLTSMYSKARKVADSEMFRWSGFEGRDPKRWKILSDNDAVPIPSNTKKIKQGQKEWQLEPAEVEILNNIALDRYATLVIPFIEANKDNMATLNKPNEKTGKIPYVERINDKWRMALEYAKREMIRQKVQEQK